MQSGRNPARGAVCRRLIAAALLLAPRAEAVVVSISLPSTQPYSLPAFSYADFAFTVTEHQATHSNLVLEVKDVSVNPNQNAVEAYLHEGDVPHDARDTERFVTMYTDRENRELALAVNVIQLDAMTYHIVLFGGPRDTALEITVDLVGA